MSSANGSFVKKISKGEVIGLFALLFIKPMIRLVRSLLIWHPRMPAYIGLFLPPVLNTIGTAISMGVIGKSTSGASVKVPSIIMKGIIGIVICEANLVFSMLSYTFLKDKTLELASLPENTREERMEGIQRAWAIFASGLVAGGCGLTASLGSSIVNAASTISIASNPKIFSKLVTLQLIVGGVGALGLIMSLFFLKIF
ncbi:V-type H+-transporting ATPase 21kDa proteolipid subunit [Nematocida sp. AWRm80]|nr:V-type H+-transporting ATPase 21kDa proteolipid subunit [Nematocida sp. AWRm80]